MALLLDEEQQQQQPPPDNPRLRTRLVQHQPQERVPASTSSSSRSSTSRDKDPHDDNPHQQPPLPKQDENQNTFPVTISKTDTGNDLEEIDHPVLAYGGILPDDLAQTMVVPKFWNPSRYGGNVREYLGNHGKQLPSKETALSIGSKIPLPTKDGEQQQLDTIFVSIASYRDPECLHTLESIYARAQYPQRIRTVVVDQRRDDDTYSCLPTDCDDNSTNNPNALCQYRHLLELYDFDARLAVGPTFARHVAYRHYRGEYFAMQIDSHVRFVQDFDTDIIQQLKSANNEMAVLSTYLLDLNGAIDPVTHASKRNNSRALLCNVYFENGVVHNGQQAARPSHIVGTPTLHPFWAAGFSFARGHFLVTVPYDPYLPMVFQGEEISMAVRGFTYGYDFYAPERSVCFHMYALHKNRANRLAVPRFTENRKLYRHVTEEDVAVAAMTRLRGIIGMTTNSIVERDNHNALEQESYGVGQVRSPAQFYKTFGIHVDSQTMENHLCWFAGESMQNKFVPFLRKDGMGIDYDKLNYEFKDPAPDQP
eukprot:Sro494_g154300.1 Glycosyltransferase (GlcNAc) (537) ;mRNA; r:41981-43591